MKPAGRPACDEMINECDRCSEHADCGGGPLLLTAGVTMAVVAARRRSSQQQAFAPVLGPTMIGAVWQRRF